MLLRPRLLFGFCIKFDGRIVNIFKSYKEVQAHDFKIHKVSNPPPLVTTLCTRVYADSWYPRIK